ncbi:ROK family protein [Archaeoglobales archaeon]|nr:MAG: ROK family protein [Archaeoglobales archaeon]
MVFLGIDVGGTNIDVVVMDGEFEVGNVFSTKVYLPRFYELLDKLLSTYKPKAIGVGAAMWFRDNKPVKAPNLPELIDVRGTISNTPIFWDNDANCFALYCSIVEDARNLLGITIGTGIGCGIVVDKNVVRGGGLACEIGHIFVGGRKKCVCGGHGHLECYFSGWSLKNPEELIKSGKIYKIKGFNLLCKAIANAVMLLDPDFVAIGGRIGGRLNGKKLKNGIYEYVMPHFNPEIKIVNDPLAVAKGACYLAKLSYQSR